MKLFEVDVELGDEVVIGALSVFPLTGVRESGPAYLTGPEAFEAGVIQVSDSIHLKCRRWRSSISLWFRSCSWRVRCSSAVTRTGP